MSINVAKGAIIAVVRRFDHEGLRQVLYLTKTFVVETSRSSEAVAMSLYDVNDGLDTMQLALVVLFGAPKAPLYCFQI